MPKHKCKFVFSTHFFNYERNKKGRVLRCKCGCECFETTVENMIYKEFVKNGKTYYNKTEAIFVK